MSRTGVTCCEVLASNDLPLRLPTACSYNAHQPIMDNAAERRQTRKFGPAKQFRLALLLLLCSLASARAMVRFDVFLGYDGILPEASWFPVSFEVQNDGPSFTGVVEISPGQFNQSQTRLMTVELPTGTMKRFVVPAYSSSRFTYNWNARLLDERGKVRAEALNIRLRKQNQWPSPLAGAIARTAAGMPTLPETKSKQNDIKPEVARLQIALFPDSPIALEGLDAIYLNSEKALDLKVPQVVALLAWLRGGGHLIVGVEQVIHVNGNEWLRQLLPCELTTMGSVQNHGDIQEWLRSTRRNDGKERSYRAFPAGSRKSGVMPPASEGANPFANLSDDSKFEEQPLEAAMVGARRDGAVLMGSQTVPLALTAKRGRGQLTVLLFSTEMEPFLSWKNRAHFWAKLVDLPPELLSSEQNNNPYYSQSIDGAFGSMIDSKQVRKLPVGWLLLLLLAYLVVIGPLDQFWLKKMNKQMLTWLTFPAYVACFSVLIYLIGYKLRAGETEWNELHLVDVLPVGQQADLRGRTYASVYSPVNAHYKLASEQPFAALRGELLGSYGGGGQEASRASVMQKDNSFQADISVPVWTSQLYISDWWQPRGELPLSVSITAQGGGWRVEVENRLDRKLTQTKLIIKDQVLDLGELPAKETKKFTFSGGGQSLRGFVQTHANHFQQAVNQRQQAFGGNTVQIYDMPNSTMAASFISQIRDPQAQQSYNNPNFLTPHGMDLSPLVERGDAVLLAWAADYSPIKPMNRFSARRNRRDTLLRVAVEVKNDQ